MRLVSVIAAPACRRWLAAGPRLSGRLELSQRCAERIKARRVGKPVVFDGRRTVAVTAASSSSVRLIVGMALDIVRCLERGNERRRAGQ